MPDIEEQEEIEEAEQKFDDPIIVNTALDNILELRRKLNPNSINEIVSRLNFIKSA